MPSWDRPSIPLDDLKLDYTESQVDIFKDIEYAKKFKDIVVEHFWGTNLAEKTLLKSLADPSLNIILEQY